MNTFPRRYTVLATKSFIMKSIWLAILVLSAMFFQSCASHKNVTSTPSIDSKGSKSDGINHDEFDRLFFEAEKEKLKGNNNKALDYFKSAAKQDEKNAAAYYEIGNIYFNQSKFAESEQQLLKAVSLSPSNKWYRILLADIYQNQKKWAQAGDTYEKLISLYPDDRDFYFSLAGVYVYQNKVNDATRVYDRIEKHFGPTDDLILQKYKIYYTLGKYDKAIDELNKLLVKDPNNLQYLEIAGQTYLKAGNEDKAFEIFQRLEKAHPEDPMAQLALAEFYQKKGQKEKAVAMIRKAFANPSLNIDNKIQILYSAYMTHKLDSNEMAEAIDLAAIIAKAHPEDAKSHSVYGDLLYEKKDLTGARAEYRKSVELKNNVYAVWGNILQIDAELKDNKALDEESAKAMLVFPNQPVVYFFNGLARNEEKKYKQAIESLNSGLALITDEVKEKVLVTQFYINLAESYYREKDFKKSNDNFEKALTLESNNTLALNNYAYYLSLRNEKLERAEQMSKKTVELDPKNASYQDTYGWILFKLGRYAEAEVWIKKAVDQEHSAEVSEHYGDALYKLGRTSEALEYWEKAKKLGSDNPTLDKKIAARRIIE
jgi:tetratricopeptide (TPR) repeat protein